MTYRIVVSRPAQRDLRGIGDRTIRQRMANAIESLAENPRPQLAERLRGVGDQGYGIEQKNAPVDSSLCATFLDLAADWQRNFRFAGMVADKRRAHGLSS